MPDRLLNQGSPEEEERFKYEVIRGLSESVRELAKGMAEMQKTQVGMLERLARLEANKFDTSIIDLGSKFSELDRKVDTLFVDKNRRDGAVGLMTSLRTWGPVVFSLLTVLYFAGRSMGLIPSPPTTVTKIETPITVDRKDEVPHQFSTNGAQP